MTPHTLRTHALLPTILLAVRGRKLTPALQKENLAKRREGGKEKGRGEDGILTWKREEGGGGRLAEGEGDMASLNVSHCMPPVKRLLALKLTRGGCVSWREGRKNDGRTLEGLLGGTGRQVSPYDHVSQSMCAWLKLSKRQRIERQKQQMKTTIFALALGVAKRSGGAQSGRKPAEEYNMMGVINSGIAGVRHQAEGAGRNVKTEKNLEEGDGPSQENKEGRK